MHANRPFLLGNMYSPNPSNADNPVTESSDELPKRVQECILSAKKALQIVDEMAGDSTLFHSLWWTSYVTFCALTVVYVWSIRTQTSSSGCDESLSSNISPDVAGLYELAERCYGHLAQATAEDSPSRRYSVILEELRTEARSDIGRGQLPNSNGAVSTIHDESDVTVYQQSISTVTGNAHAVDYVGTSDGSSMYLDRDAIGHIDSGVIPTLFDEWQTTDWLDLDSLVWIPQR